MLPQQFANIHYLHQAHRRLGLRILDSVSETQGRHAFPGTDMRGPAGRRRGHHHSRIMKQVPLRAIHRVKVRDAEGKPRMATMELRYRRMVVCPPIGKHSRRPKLTLTVLHAEERNPAVGQGPIVWKLLTDLEVRSREQAIEKLQWYAQRWKIEVFHKILKSGCRAEESLLRTADRLVNLLAILSIDYSPMGCLGVYVSYMQRRGWYCQFLEEVLKTSLPRRFSFAASDKVIELGEQTPDVKNTEPDTP